VVDSEGEYGFSKSGHRCQRNAQHFGLIDSILIRFLAIFAANPDKITITFSDHHTMTTVQKIKVWH
jgi:hypothetical protein